MKRSDLLIMLMMMVSYSMLYGQGKIYQGPDDPAGDQTAMREGYMNGNRVFILFENTTELSSYPNTALYSRWPNDYTGTTMVAGVLTMIAAQVFIKNDTIPVTDEAEIEALSAQGLLDTLWYNQTYFRGGANNDRDPTGTINWGLYPPFGYFNITSETPALSNDPDSWPPAGWPSTGDEKKWPGVWNGRFGLGVQYADLESYFVANDAQDLEYLGPEDTVKYYPRPNVRIGDKKPDVSIQYGEPWGGLGIRIETRGYQWNNPLVRDAIFWENNVANISDYDLPQCAFGYKIDNYIGQDFPDDVAYFDDYIDMSYSWDMDGVGVGGVKTGVMGLAYLESPGKAYNQKDDDQDGLIDERRDNPAGAIIGPSDGIADLAAFLRYYNLKESDLKDHWSGDEDQDWDDGNDENNNGKYEPNEYPGDDVGLDGIGPNDLNYPGPDEGECDHMPSYRQGVGCEPDFNATDISESDMLGLTAFDLYGASDLFNGQSRLMKNDWVIWQIIGTGYKNYVSEISNLFEIFGSGVFPLHQGREERISMAMLHSYDDLSGIMPASEPKAPVLFKLKGIVQLIYESDYRFARPPLMPTLKATAYDGKVVLTWDDLSDLKTREGFLGGENDFEGYKLYRSTDKKFQDSRVITDGYGTPTFFKPIFECDKIDTITGFTDFGLLHGMGYYLGDDTGIQHYYVDNNVINGVTYYYALVAYDYGIPPEVLEPGFAPSENNIVINLDEFENVISVGPNVQIVTPRQTSLGYKPHEIEILESSIKGTSGSVGVEIFSKDALKVDHLYKLKFTTEKLKESSLDPKSVSYVPNGYELYDITDTTAVLIGYENPSRNQNELVIEYDISLTETPRLVGMINPTKQVETDVKDGLKFIINNAVPTSLHGGFDYGSSRWLVGNGEIEIIPSADALELYPWDYELIFTGDESAYKMSAKKPTRLKDENGNTISRSTWVDKTEFSFFMVNKTFPNDTLAMMAIDTTGAKQYDLLGNRFLFAGIDKNNKYYKTLFFVSFKTAPQAGDVYYATFKRPFYETDSLVIKVLPEPDIDKEEIKNKMDLIKVVPNPYVATNLMEPVLANWQLNQRRAIMFTHLPQECSIKIFTSSGVLVDEIEVVNSSGNGIAYWDLKTNEGIEAAAGMYIYHVQADGVDNTKIGKFAIIK